METFFITIETAQDYKNRRFLLNFILLIIRILYGRKLDSKKMYMYQVSVDSMRDNTQTNTIGIR